MSIAVITSIVLLTTVLIIVTVIVTVTTCIVVRRTKKKHTFELSTGILHVVIYSLCYFNRCSTRVY